MKDIVQNTVKDVGKKALAVAWKIIRVILIVFILGFIYFIKDNDLHMIL